MKHNLKLPETKKNQNPPKIFKIKFKFFTMDWKKTWVLDLSLSFASYGVLDKYFFSKIWFFNQKSENWMSKTCQVLFPSNLCSLKVTQDPLIKFSSVSLLYKTFEPCHPWVLQCLRSQKSLSYHMEEKDILRERRFCWP